MRTRERHELYSCPRQEVPCLPPAPVRAWSAYRYFLTGLSFILQLSLAMTDAIASTPQLHIACSSVSLSHTPIIGRCRPSTNIPASWLPRFAVRDSFQTSVCDCTRKAPIFRAHCRQALGRSNGLANVPWHRATGIPLSVACYIVSCQLNRNASSRRLPSQRMKMPLHLDRNWFITCAAELY